MRKLKLLCLCGLTAAVLMTGCAGSTDTTNVNLGSATVSEYRGVKINVAAPEVTDDEVDQKIQTNLKQNPNEVEVDRAAQDGDIVNIDYKGTKDGEAFDGGTAEGQDLTLGSGSMIDGFEDGLVGAKKGETKTLDLTFPENYREESLAGQAVVFEVTVNAVKEKQDAVLDDAFVQRTSDYQTVDEYKEGIRADLLAQKQKTAEQEMEQDVLQDIIDNSDFKFSRNGLSVRYNQMLKQYTNQAKMYGMTLSQMAQANGMDEAGFKEYIYSSVKEAAKKEIVVKDIAAKEGLDNLTDEDKEAFAQANGTSKDTLVSLYGEDTVNEQVLQDKVLRFLASNADNEAENPAKLSEREVTVTETSADQESSPEETTEAETTAELKYYIQNKWIRRILYMQLLKDRIRKDGKIKAGNVLKVDSFLNHQMDIKLFGEIGKEFKRRFADVEVNKILTIEASGIGIACIVAQYFDVPVVFAKKTQTKNIAGEVYTSKVESFTHGRVYDIIVSKEFLGKGDKVLLIDDFLANGKALEGLAALVRDSGAELVGAGIVIEKGFQVGGDLIRSEGIRLESLAIVDSMDEETGTIVFRDDE